MRLVAYDPVRHQRLQGPLPRAMATQLQWLHDGSEMTIFVPYSTEHPKTTCYSAGSIDEIASSPEEAALLRDPNDRLAWLIFLCIWAHQIHEGGQ